VETFSTVKTGELAGTGAAAQCPDIEGQLLKFKAASDNAGSVYIGAAGVTVRDGATDVTTGLELAPGDDSGWIPVDGLTTFYYRGAVGDDLTYLVLD
jgi:hypothetical protein